MTVSWDELWEEINWDRVTTIPFITERIHAIKAEGDRLQSAITQINECIGEYESKEWCGHCSADSKCALITMHVLELKKKGDILDFLFGKKAVRTENLMKLQIWREKAELWDQYAIYDNDNEPKILVKDLIIAYEKLEDVREFVLSRRSDIEQDMENFGMLAPVLEYFLKVCVRD